jgi:hypothetical protein
VEEWSKLFTLRLKNCQEERAIPPGAYWHEPFGLIPPERHAVVETTLGRMLSGEKIHRAELEVLSKDGRLIALEVRGRALRIELISGSRD